MITTVAELLKAFAEEERSKLDAQNITHGPTIGDMYEGLTRELLGLSLPEGLGLQVVQGFATFGDKLSGQLDCMLVQGEGDRIPFTDSYRWHIKDVLAVFEVKKTLTAADLSDGFFHLRDISQLYGEYLESEEAKDEPVSLRWPRKVFAQITGVVPPPHSEIETLPFDLEMIYHTLVTEFLGPVRIIVGHHGWKKETTLRDHVFTLLSERLSNPAGLGVGSFPQLVIGGAFSLVKANGFPYTPPLMDGMWPFLLSTSHNPLRIMLELLFTKLDLLHGTALAAESGVEQEAMTPCLRARAVQRQGRSGWEYMYDGVAERVLKDRGSSYDWTPAELSQRQFVIMSRLCEGRTVNVADERFVEFANKEPGGAEAFVQSLLETRLVARRGNELVLTTEKCEVLFAPDGNCYAAENNAGQLSAWIESVFGLRREDWSTLAITRR